jgi:1-acyl-sn-glycerol-3-phosphate acyltransferase
MLRTLVSLPVIAAATLLSGLVCIVVGLVDRSGLKAHEVSGRWGAFLLWCLGVRVELIAANERPPGPAVYAANHASVLDIPILFAHMPVDFRIIHKRSLFLIPVIGLYLKVCGHVAIDRRRAFKARKSLDKAIRRISGGLNVLVFPEGTRSSTSEVQPFKRGSFVLAIDAGVPVVPVSLCGVKAVIPRGILSLRPGLVRVVVHSPVPTTGRTGGDAGRLAEEVRAVVTAACAAA